MTQSWMPIISSKSLRNSHECIRMSFAWLDFAASAHPGLTGVKPKKPGCTDDWSSSLVFLRLFRLEVTMVLHTPQQMAAWASITIASNDSLEQDD